MKRKTIIKGTLILTAASLISRILGFVNRIYLSNLIGAEGMGLYQLVFPIYMVCYTICCSGTFIAISRLTSSNLATGHKKQAKKTVLIATTLSTMIGIVLSLLVIFFSDYIAEFIIHEKRISDALKIMAISIPFCSISHSLKGYFYGQSMPTVPAIAIVFEQIIRISLIYFFSLNFLSKGLVYACNAAILAMAVGEAISCIYVLLSFKISTYKIKGKSKTSALTTTKQIANIAVPLTTNRLITTLLTSYETILIPSKLIAHGFSHNYAISIYGTLTGMAMPLIFFPTVLTSSASLMLLSSISEAHAKKQSNIIQLAASKTIKYSLLLGIVFTAFFFLFGHELGIIIYNEEYVGTLLVTLGFLCPFLYLISTLTGILNGINKHMITFRNNVIGLTIRIIFIYSFIPILGITGYLYGLIASLLVVASLDIFFIIRHIQLKFNAYNQLLKPILSVGIVSVIMQIMLNGSSINILSNYKLNYLIYIVIYFLLIIVTLLITQTISIKELRAIKKQKY